MKEVKVTELKRNLRGYLAGAQRGERIHITSRGKVIAELAPRRTSPEEAAAARARLRASVLRYRQPLEPAIEQSEWEMNR
jgi:prevent-host-death family protein